MKNKFLPLSKSWAVRMIFLDMLYGVKTGYRVIKHLQKERNILADDIRAALNCAQNYISGKNTYNVGDSGTVCRFLIYFLDGRKYKIKKGKQLTKRKISAPKNIKSFSLAKLLKLGTSQFASAALLAGVKPMKNLPLKCRLSILARKIYFKNKGEWIPKFDEVIIRQLSHFLYDKKFKPLIAEDYCYARAFGFIAEREGKKKWPELSNHECNRLKVMEEACQDFDKKIDIHKDHRVAMAVVLRQLSLGLPIRINNKKCVSKSWPQFWQWLDYNKMV